MQTIAQTLRFRLVTFVLMIGALVSWAAEPKVAKPLEAMKINVDFEKLPIEQALVAVAKEIRSRGGQMNIVIARTLVEASEQVEPDLISLHMQEVTPLDAISAIVRPIFWTFSVKENTVYLWDGTVCPTQPMATRVFTVPKKFFPATRAGNNRFDVSEVLKDQGVTFNEGSFALYQPAKQLLIVRDSKEDLDLIQALIEYFRSKKR